MGQLSRSFPSWIDLQRHRSRQLADKLVYRFLQDGEKDGPQITYRRLDERARAIGSRLQSLGAAGDRAVLLFPPGLEFITAFIGCLYAGTVAAPVSPPRPRQLGRLRSIVEDCDPAVVLTDRQILPRLRSFMADAPWLAALPTLSVNEIGEDEAADWRRPEVGKDSLAFLQYTSGSTSTPKGVMVSHGNLLDNGERLRSSCGHREGDTFVSWLPVYHDMGLIGMVLQTVFAGAFTVLMPPVSFVQRPLRWLHAISQFGASYSGGPNFAFDLCSSRAEGGDLEGIDLGCWKTAFNGAEPVRAETLERFARVFSPYGFRREALFPCYGMAETTLVVSGGSPDRPTLETFDASKLSEKRVAAAEPATGARTLVGCGLPVGGHEVAIVDPEDCRPCAGDRIGEIWISGPSVTQGYWRRPEATAETFGATLLGRSGRRYLRTGDLGFLSGDQVFVAGRIKDLVIVRGRNHYPQDLELTAEQAHPALKPGCGAAFLAEVEGAERLVLVSEVERGFDGEVEAVAREVRRAIAEEHEVQLHHLVLIRSRIPKTTSGKIQRFATREAWRAGRLRLVGESVVSAELPLLGEQAAPDRTALLALEPEQRRLPLEGYLASEVARIARLDTSLLEPDRPLTELGLDSLAAVELLHTVERDLGVILDLTTLLEGASLEGLSRQLAGALEDPVAAPLQAASSSADGNRHSLSFMQQAIWFHHQLLPESAAYNIPFAARLAPETDPGALGRAFRELTRRHGVLRSAVELEGGTPLLRSDAHGPAELAVHRLGSAGGGEADLEERLVDAARRPFDLTAGPLVRGVLYLGRTGEKILLLVFHHLVLDGWSFWILLEELAHLYTAESTGVPAGLQEPAAVFGDFVRYQQEMVRGPRGERMWRYWESELGGEAPALNLPLDHPRPETETDAGGIRTLSLDADLTFALRELARAHGTTLYTVHLAAFQILLARMCGDRRVVVGAPASGRSRADFGQVVGCLFNAVPLVADLAADPPLQEFLASVRGALARAVENQDFPSHLLAERLPSEFRGKGGSFFPAMLIYQKPRTGIAFCRSRAGRQTIAFEIGGLSLELIPLEERTARSDLELELVEVSDGTFGWFRFRADLFERETIDRLARYYLCLLREMTCRPNARLSSLGFLEQADFETLLDEWSHAGTARPALPLEVTAVHEWFERQAIRTPDKLVTVHGETHLTFRELDRAAGQLGSLLTSLDELG